MENHPEWLADSIKGLSLKSAMAASESFKEQAGIRSAMLFFRDYFGAALTMKIYKKNIMNVIATNTVVKEIKIIKII